MLHGGIGPLTHAVRTGEITTQYDVDKVARWKREAEKRLHPGGDSLEAVADFNKEYCEDFVLGDVAVEGFSLSTKWQRQVVSDIIAELEETTMVDSDRQWDGWSFNDLTYCITEKMYMQTTAFYNYRWHMTIPVFTTFVRGLTALHYARHFELLQILP